MKTPMSNLFRHYISNLSSITIQEQQQQQRDTMNGKEQTHLALFTSDMIDMTMYTINVIDSIFSVYYLTFFPSVLWGGKKKSYCIIRGSSDKQNQLKPMAQKIGGGSKFEGWKLRQELLL